MSNKELLSTLRDFRIAWNSSKKETYSSLFLYPYVMGVRDGFCQGLAINKQLNAAAWVLTFDIEYIVKTLLDMQYTMDEDTFLFQAVIKAIIEITNKKIEFKNPDYISLKSFLDSIYSTNNVSHKLVRNYIIAIMDFCMAYEKFDAKDRQALVKLSVDRICEKIKIGHYTRQELEKVAHPIIFMSICQLLDEEKREQKKEDTGLDILVLIFLILFFYLRFSSSLK